VSRGRKERLSNYKKNGDRLAANRLRKPEKKKDSGEQRGGEKKTRGRKGKGKRDVTHNLGSLNGTVELRNHITCEKIITYSTGTYFGDTRSSTMEKI